MENGEQIFRWVAATGAMGTYIGGTTPRDFSPCGICLERNCAQLFSHPERYSPISTASCRWQNFF